MLENASAAFVIDFDLLHNAYCKVYFTY